MAWLGALALVLQLIATPAHDAADVASAFATASRSADSHQSVAHAALALLDEHRHGPQNGSPLGDSSQGKQPACPLWQAGQNLANLLQPTPPDLPQPLLVAAVADQQLPDRRHDARVRTLAQPRAPPALT
ncbi:MAG TPA: hypothetical protein VEU47_02450 [Candidatus Cybelea sp.]|nr:hypothetical protein [Candidatus Cybelea sp.]